MSTIFFLYHFNDVDQISPVIWKLAQRGEPTAAVMLDPAYDIAADPRLDFLRRNGDFQAMSITDILPGLGIGWLFRQHDGRTDGLMRRALRRVLRQSGISVGWAEAALRRMEARVCVFEWGGEGGRNRTEFLRAAKRLGLRTVCLPHGHNVYTNPQASTAAIESARSAIPIRRDYNVYDAYVFQSRRHRDKDIGDGMDPDMCRVIGSARYCPEWYPVLNDIYPDFVPEESADGRLKVVFMLQQWTYNVDRWATESTISTLAAADWIYLVVREHPRDTGRLSNGTQRRLEAHPATETTADAPSSSLMDWADVVINFASSIAIEAVARNTPVINPRYCHTNSTVFDSTGAALQAGTEAELLFLLRTFVGDASPGIPEPARQSLLRETVYGGSEPFDVLAAYCDVVSGTDNPANAD